VPPPRDGESDINQVAALLGDGVGNAELVLGKKLNGASVFITLLLTWILVRFVSSLLFKKKNLPPCKPSSSSL
jgi:hypothetical protein